MAKYRTLQAVTYIQDGQVINVKSAGIDIELTAVQAAALSGAVIYVGTLLDGNGVPPEGDVFYYDSVTSFPTIGFEGSLYLDQTAGTLYEYNDGVYTLISGGGGGGGGGTTNLAVSRDANAVTITSDTGTDAIIAVADSSNAGVLNTALYAKLASIATGATANSSDATLLNRANHTGSQPVSTISDSTTTGRALVTAADAAAAKTAIALQNVDNTSDVNKPVSTAQQTALDAKVSRTAAPIQFSAATATIGSSPSDYAYAARTLTGARMRVVSAPVGSSLSVDVQHHNGTSWSTVSTLTITAGSTTEVTTSFTQAQTVGQMVRVNVTSVGSTTAATGVIVDVTVS